MSVLAAIVEQFFETVQHTPLYFVNTLAFKSVEMRL